MATKSTLNSKLKKVSQIKFYTSAGKGGCTKIQTSENGLFDIKVGFKQPSRASSADPYQIQYRCTSRYTAANAKLKGANWTGWSAWKNAIDVTGIPANATTDPNTWLKCNKKVVTNSDYLTFVQLSAAGALGTVAYSIGSGYSARAFQFRVRTYNAKTKKHGDWVTSSTLYVYKAAAVQGEEIHRDVDGALLFDCEYKWDRGGSVHVDSVKDETGRELLVEPVILAMQTDSLRQGVTPGWQAGEFTIPMESLKRAIEYGEDLALSAYFQTKDGAKTQLESAITVASSTPGVDDVRIETSTDLNTGLLTVEAYRTAAEGAEGANTINRIDVNASYLFRGRKYTVTPKSKQADLTIADDSAPILKATFADVPYGIELTINVTVANSYHASKTCTETATFNCGTMFYLNSADGERCAALWNRAHLENRSKAKATIELPYGRELPFAVFSKGQERPLMLSGTITERSVTSLEVPDPERAGLAAWFTIRNNPGIYWLRTPDGERYKVAVTEVNISGDRPDRREVSVRMEEVS